MDIGCAADEKLTFYAQCAMAARSFDAPLCSISNQIFMYKPEEGGWRDKTTEVIRELNSRNAWSGKKMFQVICDNYQLDSQNISEEKNYVYYKWVCHTIPILDKETGKPTGEMGVDHWKGHWEGYDVKGDEVIFCNGILNIITFHFQPFYTDDNPIILFGPMISIPYVPELIPKATFAQLLKDSDSEIAKMLRFISLNKKNPEAFCQIMMQWCSSILQPHVNIKKEIYLYGESNTLKSTFAKAISYAPFGKNYVSETTQDEIVKTNWGSSSLVNKAVNISDDSRHNPAYISWFKRYTGSSTYVVERKFAQPTVVPATAKMINCTNLIHFEDSSDAMSNRVKSFSFDNIMRSSQSIDSDKYVNANYWLNIDRRKDTLGIMLISLHELHINGKYATDEDLDREEEAMKREADPNIENLTSALEYGHAKKDFVTTEQLITFLDNKLSSGVKYRQLAGYMKKLFPKANKKCGADGKRKYTGVRLRDGKDTDFIEE